MIKTCLACWMVLCAPAAWAFAAADLAPPSWRGQPGTTLQSWSFNTDSNPATPEVLHNPYGPASAEIYLGFLASGWLSELEGLGTAKGFWDLGGSGGQIVCSAANRPLTEGTTEIWVQVVYWRDISQGPDIEIQNATRVDTQLITVEAPSTGGFWMLEQSRWELPASPPGEQIVFVANPRWGTLIDSVILDTRSSVPSAGCPWIFGDLDADDDVDDADLGVFQACARGPGMPYEVAVPRCHCLDADGDDDVDQCDYGILQRCLTGPDAVGDPSCAG